MSASENSQVCFLIFCIFLMQTITGSAVHAAQITPADPGYFPIKPARPDSYTVTFVARPSSITNQVHGPSSPFGHVYVIISPPSSSKGAREQTFGFYPLENGLLGKIKGPGMLRAENRCLPVDECSKGDYAKKVLQAFDMAATTQIAITDSQKKDIFATINKWGSRPFNLTDSNCVSFVSDVLKAAGYEPPVIEGANRLPVNYIAAVRDSVKAQVQIREAKKSELAANDRAAEAEKNANLYKNEKDQAISDRDKALKQKEEAEIAAKEAESKRKDVEKKLKELEKNTIPIGWGICDCPAAHAKYGKIINGKLYHGPEIKCP